MITLMNVWHYVLFSVIIIFIALSIWAALKGENKKLRGQIMFSVFVLSSVIGGFGIFAVDKYTKIVNIYKLENKRNLSTETIMYSGIVRNEGNYEIGEVTFEIKLVNRGHDTGNIKAGSFFKPSGFFGFFTGESFERQDKPQQVVHTFVVAENLVPGESREFRVYFPYPPYFRAVSQFTKLYAH